MRELIEIAGVVIVVMTLIVMAGCGRPAAEDPYGPPAGAQSGAAQGVDAVVARECGRCHNGRTHPLKLLTGAALAASTKAREELEEGEMPPDRQLAPDVKNQLLSVY